MKTGFYLAFEEKTERLDLGDGPQDAPVGRLLFAFLDVPWQALIDEVLALAPTGQPFLGCDLAGRIRTQCGCLWELVMGPLLGTVMLDELCADPLDTASLRTAIARRFAPLAGFQAAVLKAVGNTLDVDGVHADLTPTQRYYLYRQSEPLFLAQALELYGMVSVQTRISVDGRLDFAVTPQEPTPALIQTVAGLPLRAHTFFCADDVRALVLLDFDHMCAQSLAVRRCANCGRYFVPFSARARYCDRPLAGTEKPCKEYAALHSYRTRINSDQAKRLLAKRSNTYRMRVKRNPAQYPEQGYQHWLDHAGQMLDHFSAGEIDLTKFDAETVLP